MVRKFGRRSVGWEMQSMLRTAVLGAFLWDDPDPSGSVIIGQPDHGASKEPMNLLWTMIDAP